MTIDFHVTSCNHQNLVLLPAAAPRLRCRRCHLTLSAAELEGGPCPECLDATGRRNYDFEPVPGDGSGHAARYRCEDCGAMIGPEPAAS